MIPDVPEYEEIPEWISRATPVSEPTLEVGFTVREDFYYGPENGFSQETWRLLREPVYQPKLELFGEHAKWALTSVLEPSLDEIIRYYADILRVAEKHGSRVGRSDFWLRPFMISPGELDVPFFYSDTREDAEFLFDGLERTEDGPLYDGIDQGWELWIVGAGDRIFIRHGDFDTGEEHACVSIDRAALVRQVAPLRARLRRIIARLVAEFGGDYWTYPPTGPMAKRWRQRLWAPNGLRKLPMGRRRR